MMNNKDRIVLSIKWLARISGTLILVFVLFFLLMDIFGTEGSEGEGVISTKDMFTFICFPISTIIGLAIAWKWEGLGGLTSTVGFVCLSFIRPDLSSNLLFLSLAIPGLLYLLFWFMTKKLN